MAGWPPLLRGTAAAAAAARAAVWLLLLLGEGMRYSIVLGEAFLRIVHLGIFQARTRFLDLNHFASEVCRT